MTSTRKAAFVVSLALPATAFAQRTGVSHPEEIPVTTSSEGISQPVIYAETPGYTATPAYAAAPAGGRTAGTVSAPALKVRAADPPILTDAPVLTASVAPIPVEEAPPAVLPRDTDRSPLASAADPDANIVTRVPGPSNQLPIGSMLKVILRETVSTVSTVTGTNFSAELREPVERDGHVLLPAGSMLHGRVTEVHGGKRISGPAAIHLQPLTVTLPDGTRYNLHAQVIDTGLNRQTKIDEEGTILRRDHARGTLAAVGLSTGSGAAAGAVFGGWPGALIGAGVGAGVSTVVWLKQEKQTEVPSGTDLTFALTRPLEVGLN